MGKPQKKYDPSQEQEQGQANLQGQLQGQGQAQLAVQSLDSKSDNNNSNILADQSALHDEFAYIHGQICVSPAGAVVGFGACANGGARPA